VSFDKAAWPSEPDELRTSAAILRAGVPPRRDVCRLADELDHRADEIEAEREP
jgi:hypothetical protein